MAFWSTSNETTKDPKRNFRFKVSITGIVESGIWYAKTCDKPSFTIETTEHQYLNHTFYYPGAVKWQTVSLQLVDPADPDVTATVASIVQKSGYRPPGTATGDSLKTMTKGTAVAALGQVTIQQLNGAGIAIETWTLKNAFITEAKFGSLEYGSDDLTTLDLTLQYDWATCNTTQASLTEAPETDFFGVTGP